MSLARRAVAGGSGRALRVAARISQREAAAVIGCSAASLCRYEVGERMPRGRIALAYGRLIDQWSREHPTVAIIEPEATEAPQKRLAPAPRPKGSQGLREGAESTTLLLAIRHHGPLTRMGIHRYTGQDVNTSQVTNVMMRGLVQSNGHRTYSLTSDGLERVRAFESWRRTQQMADIDWAKSAGGQA